jgi:plastocyanin
MRRVAGSLLCATLLLVGACAKDENPTIGGGTPTPTAETVSGAQTYTIAMDEPAPDGKLLQYSAYYPKSVRVRPGDTVVFDNKSKQSIHTVTFGVSADRKDQPAIVTSAIEGNPVVFGPCYTDQDPKPDLFACPGAPTGAPAAGPPPAAPTLSGKGYWNSGQLAPDITGIPEPPPAEARRSTVKLADSIAPGSYHFVCLIHPYMDGTLEVVNKDEDRVSPDAVAKAGDQAAQVDVEAAGKLAEPRGTAETGKATVVAGAGDKVVAINQFFPAALTVKAGDTVTWKDESPYEPHTVTFQSPFKSPEDKGVFKPGGVASGKPYQGGFAHSGLIGPAPFFPGDSFSLKFTKPGQYSYLCMLHPGMGALVTVE